MSPEQAAHYAQTLRVNGSHDLHLVMYDICQRFDFQLLWKLYEVPGRSLILRYCLRDEPPSFLEGADYHDLTRLVLAMWGAP